MCCIQTIGDLREDTARGKSLTYGRGQIANASGPEHVIACEVCPSNTFLRVTDRTFHFARRARAQGGRA